MYFRELFEEKVYEQSTASALAKSLIDKVSNPEAIKKATDYLVNLANVALKTKDKEQKQQEKRKIEHKILVIELMQEYIQTLD